MNLKPGRILSLNSLTLFVTSWMCSVDNDPYGWSVTARWNWWSIESIRSDQIELIRSHLSVQKVTFFKKRDYIQSVGSKKSVSSHLSIRKWPIERKGKGGDPSIKERDSIQPDRSSHLSAQKLIFFKERKRRGSFRRDSIQPDGSKKSDGKLSS